VCRTQQLAVAARLGEVEAGRAKRDAKGQIGAFEASLMNTPLAVADQPLEILRTLHSFDPCLACSTHVMSPDGAEMASVKVV
jgi:hydrogenase large subunit